MTGARAAILGAGAALAAAPSRVAACPFCDVGGQDTAYFIVAFIGFMALGMAAIFLAFVKSGGLARGARSAGAVRPEDRVLEAEGIRPPKRGKNENGSTS